MFSNPSILANHLHDTICVIVCLIVFGVAGQCLAGDRLHGSDPLERLASWLVFGMLFVVGAGTTICFGRLGWYSVVPLVLIVLAALARKRLPGIIADDTQGSPWQLVAGVTAVIAGAVMLNLWQRDWFSSNGTILLAHSDLGFYAMLAKAMPAAKVANSWIATMGNAALEPGPLPEPWYHWGMIWLTMLIVKATGMPAMEALLNVASSVVLVIIILLSGAIVRAITRLSLGWSLLLGAIAIIAMPYPARLSVTSLVMTPQHSRDSLFWTLPYHFEGAQIMLGLLCWLRGRTHMALLMIAFATVSSPHFVGGAGIALGTAMLLSYACHRKEIARPAAVAVVTILASWAAIRFLFGVRLPVVTTTADSLSSAPLAGIAGAIVSTLKDSGIHLGLSLLFLPGWLALMRAKDDRTDGQRLRLLGWLALGGVMGGMAALNLLANVESFHFTDFPCSTLAMPIAIWGLALLVTNSQHWRRWLAIGSLAACTWFGIARLDLQRKLCAETPWTPQLFDQIKKHLGGETFGYFSNDDRPWWIPKYGYIAGILDSRCVRLNPLKSADMEDKFSKSYATCIPMELVPYNAGAPLDLWCIKFARAVGIRYILHTPPEPVPASIVRHCTQVFSQDGMILYQIKPEPETEPPSKASSTASNR